MGSAVRHQPTQQQRHLALQLVRADTEGVGLLGGGGGTLLVE
jgi:hypothetical protein